MLLLMGDAGLGRLNTIDPRQVWPSESADFTPWLLDNADVLSDLLGLDLELEAAEHPVGTFSLDLIGRNLSDGSRVIVENQLEESDHTHLGQIMTYAGGTDPKIIIWVAKSFRPEHRQALDWLNERTNEDTSFFAVKINVVRIGDSTPAPNFEIVSQPNEWAKQVRTITDPIRTGDKYRSYWEAFLPVLRATHPSWTRGTTSSQPWVSMSAGAGSGSNWLFTRNQNRLVTELLLENGTPEENAVRYQKLETRKEEISPYLSDYDVEWVPPTENRKRGALRIFSQESVPTIEDASDWQRQYDWYIKCGERAREAISAIGGIPQADINNNPLEHFEEFPNE